MSTPQSLIPVSDTRQKLLDIFALNSRLILAPNNNSGIHNPSPEGLEPLHVVSVELSRDLTTISFIEAAKYESFLNGTDANHSEPYKHYPSAKNLIPVTLVGDAEIRDFLGRYDITDATPRKDIVNPIGKLVQPRYGEKEPVGQVAMGQMVVTTHPGEIMRGAQPEFSYVKFAEPTRTLPYLSFASVTTDAPKVA